MHWPLEEEANRLIRESLKGVTSHAAKSDVLTAWKEQDRRSHEVYVSEGVPDPAVRRGMFHRALNPTRPELNSRDGYARARMNHASSLGVSSLGAFVDEHGYPED